MKTRVFRMDHPVGFSLIAFWGDRPDDAAEQPIGDDGSRGLFDWDITSVLNAYPLWREVTDDPEVVDALRLIETRERRQKIFDRGVAGIRKQGRRSVSLNTCMYRSEGGAKCFVGHLIPDEKYSSWMEYKGVGFVKSVRDAAGIEESDTLFARDCQMAHDCATGSSVNVTSPTLNRLPLSTQEKLVEEAFASVTEKYGLSYTKESWCTT